MRRTSLLHSFAAKVNFGSLIPLLAIAAICLPGLTPASDGGGLQPIDAQEGWVGTGYSMTCTDSECTENDGCSWLSSQYDWYFPQLRCESAGSGAGTCDQTMQLCRETYFYDTVYFGCQGTVVRWTRNYYGACG
jgi:hypothetical protein